MGPGGVLAAVVAGSVAVPVLVALVFGLRSELLVVVNAGGLAFVACVLASLFLVGVSGGSATWQAAGGRFVVEDVFAGGACSGKGVGDARR